MWSRYSSGRNLAAGNQLLGGLLYTHGDARGIVLRGDNQVGRRDDSPFVGVVVMKQCAAGGLDHADSLLGDRRGQFTHHGTGQLGIVRQLFHALRGVEHLHHASPVIG